MVHGAILKTTGPVPADSRQFVLFFFFFFHLSYTCSRWASTLPSYQCLWPLRIFPSLPSSRLTNFHGDASSAVCTGYVFIYNYSMPITYKRVYINRVRLSILLVVRCTGKNDISLPSFEPENLVSRNGFGCPVPRQPAHPPHLG